MNDFLQVLMYAAMPALGNFLGGILAELFNVSERTLSLALHLTIDENSSVLNKDSIQVEFIRFKYDYEKAARAIEDCILPNDYAENLRRGC